MASALRASSYAVPLWGTRAIGGTGILFALAGIFAFNFGYISLYWAFVPLLGLGAVLYIEVGEDFFVSLMLLASTSTLVYVVGLFALPVVAVSLVIVAPIFVILQRLGLVRPPRTIRHDAHPGWRVLELLAILLIALFARYTLYRSWGGQIPLQIGEFGSLARFVVSEIGGWVVFALGYGLQHRLRYGVLYTPGLDFAASLSSLLVTGLFLVSPHVVIMTLGLNTVGITGLYLACLPVGAVHVFMRTLTLRRAEIERQNVQLQEMTQDLLRNERMVAIGQMSSTISHQILQKVGLLGLQCDVLGDSLRDKSIPVAERLSEGQEQSARLDVSIDDLNATLSDLLIFSRDVAVQVEPYSLDMLLGEILQELQSAAAAQEVELVYLCEGGDETFPLDRIKLKQALLNVLTNAIEASPVGEQVEICLQRYDATVQVTIRDQGCGIVEADFDRVFSPFFSTKETGSGLGLPFARKIVELHGGTLRAVNNLDRGATFILTVPLARDE